MDNKLNITLDPGSSVPLYEQIFEYIKECITSRTIPEDFKLPAIRSLARELDVNTVTVVNAYRLLEENDLIYKKAGSGTYVMPLTDKINKGFELLMSDVELEYEMETVQDKEVIDFATASPDPELFSIADFRKAMNEVLERDGGKAFMYQESNGYRPLRLEISKYIRRYSIIAGAEDIHIISGAQQGIDIISKVMLSNGDYVFVESPTYAGAVAAFKSRGARVVEIKLLNDGPDMVELEKLLKLIRPKFIYIMPNFQNPTGCSYSERKKKHLLLLCKKYNTKVVEDDYLSDLSYSGSSALPIKAYDENDRVIYIKSFSKIFMPGLRVGYMIIPQELKEKFKGAKYISDISTSGLMQRVLELYFKNNIFEKHLELLKREYSLRYLEAVRTAKKHLRGASFIQPNGGINLWIRIPDGINASALLEESRKRGVIFVPGTAFVRGVEGEQYIRICFAGVTPNDIVKGIAILGQTMESMK